MHETERGKVTRESLLRRIGGLKCPKCGCRHFRVARTMHTPDFTIRRYRVCRNCGRGMVTYERRG